MNMPATTTVLVVFLAYKGVIDVHNIGKQKGEKAQ